MTPRAVEDYVLLVYKACSHYDAQGPCGICWQKGFLAYAAEQVAQALRCIHCGDTAEPKADVRPICEDCFAVHVAQARAEEREACAKIADAHMPSRADPIGPLHGAGMALAVEWIAAAIRARRG